MQGEMLPVENLKYEDHSAQYFSGIWCTATIIHLKRKKKNVIQSVWVKVSAAGITKERESLNNVLCKYKYELKRRGKELFKLRNK